MTFVFIVMAVLLAAIAMAVLAQPKWRRSAVAMASEPGVAAGPGSEAPPARPSARLIATLAVFMAIVAAGGYRWLGAPDRLAVGPGASNGSTAAEGEAPSSAQESSPDASKGPTAEQVTTMAEQLAQRLKAEPGNAQGWQILARMYLALGRQAEALDAYKKAAGLKPDDPDVLVDYANALAQAQGRTLAGEPARLIDRALKAAPGHPKALAMAGALAFERKDYAAAARHWEALAKFIPQDTPMFQQIQAGIAEARQRAGLPALTAAEPASGAAASPSLARVSGTVTLAPGLKAKAAPEDTVFVFARPADGARGMPLAILRAKVKDLPLQFTLDDSSAMSPAARLSGASKVNVGARISKSGDAMPQAGDLQGMLKDVTVGAGGLNVEINEEVGR